MGILFINTCVLSELYPRTLKRAAPHENATLEERKVALKLFSETVQVGMDEAMFAFQMSKQFPDNKHWINLAKEYMNEFLQRKIE